MYTSDEIFAILRHGAMIVGESKTPDCFDYMDALTAFLRMEKCVYHHSAKRHLRKFHGMPYGLYPYDGKFGEGYIYSNKDVIAYYLRRVDSNEEHF